MSSGTGSGKRKKKQRRIGRLSDKEQSARFIQAAKALGVGESGEAFDRAMNSLTKPRKTPKSS